MGALLLALALTAVSSPCTPDLLVTPDTPPDVVSALCEGWERAPAILRGEPLTFEWNPTATPLGVGDGSAARPEWKEGWSRFQLYAYEEPSERRAMWRLEALQPKQREQLWRQRAVIHALTRRWDARAHASDSEQWRRATGWLRPFERFPVTSEQPTNMNPGAYSRLRGMGSAALDLATFAEEAFAPVESIDPSALPVDDQVRCQEFSKLRALRALLGLPAEVASCPAFERWADFATLEAIEILFVAATGASPESLFGHMALRLARRSPDVVEASDFGTVVQLVALTGGEPNGLRYISNGLSGGYPLVALTMTLGDLVRESSQLEQRTIRRFRLKLNETERRRFVERLWEAERRRYLRYYFFTENCASETIALINGAIDPPRLVHRPAAPWVAPAAVLDVLSELIEEVPDPYPSSIDRAREATLARDRALEAMSESAPKIAVGLRAVNPVVDAEKAAALLRELPVALRPAGYEWLRRTIEIERAAVDRALGDQLRIELRARAERSTSEDAGQLALDRQRDFERESVLQERTSALARHAGFLDALEIAPHRPFSDSEQKTRQESQRVVGDFGRMLRVFGRTIDDTFAETDPVAWDASASSARIERHRALMDDSLPRSGMERLVVGTGAAWTPGLWRPTFSLRTAGLSELLGDQRRHGYQAGSGLRVLDGEVEWAVGRGWPTVLRSDVTVLSFRTIARPPAPLRRAWYDWFGWGFSLDWQHITPRPRPEEGRAFAEALFVIDEGASFGRFLVLGLGLEGRLQWNARQVAPIAAGRVSLSHRLPIGGARAIRLEGAAVPGFDIATRGWTTWMEGAVQLELPFRPVGLALRGSVVREGTLLLVGTALTFEWL